MYIFKQNEPYKAVDYYEYLLHSTGKE